MQDLAHRVAVVTGGGSGIGRGIALALADEGMDVVIADIERGPAEHVASEIRTRAVRSFAVHTDVTKQSSVDRLAQHVESEFGAVHLLSNNAGVISTGPLELATEHDWKWVFSVNLDGMVNTVRAFLPQLKAQPGEKHIVNTTSMAGLVPLADQFPIGVYTASKYAATGFSEMLAAELAEHHIGVSILCAGMVNTNLGATSARNRPPQFGGPMPVPESQPTAEPARGAMDPKDVGRIVVRGVKQDRRYIFTDPTSRSFIETRFGHILADFDAHARDEAAAAR